MSLLHMSRRRRLAVVGGVAAGMSAAARAKRMDPDLDVVVFERSRFCSYTACGLPYYVAGVIADHRELVMRTPAQFEDDGIAVHVRHEVTEIDAAAGTLGVRPLDGGPARSESWDALLLACGARPAGTNLPGAGSAGVFTLRTIEDAQAIRAWIAEHGAREAVVVGGGYIGLEMAEALVALGLETTVVEREEQVLPLVDADVGADVERELAAHGVTVRCCTAVEEIAGGERVRAVVAGGESIAADVVILGIGVRPDAALGQAAGLELGPHGGIAVDAAMRTSADGIWAAGDCCQTRHLLHGEPAYVPLGTTANKQGRVAAAGIAGEAGEAFGGVLGTAVVKVCDLQVGRTGLSEREAQAAGLDAVASSVTHISRARYYPGHRSLRVKLVAERGSGRLLGGQLTGCEGVAKRTDVVAAALHGGATVRQLAEYDLSYAPPFAPVWDPVLLAARKTAEACATLQGAVT